ncbi:MAG: hypothetical protein KDD53_10315, partial [Bdellovibrionales bacterium]|nr:hypothetical protein [Bdellovibrionales bacterium]
MTQQISQLIPRISPEIDGVGDFALLLAKELRSSYQVETVFFVTQSNGPDISEKDGFKVVSFSKDSPEKFIYSLPEAPLLIHYVGYGFDKNGAPTWIPRAL